MKWNMYFSLKLQNNYSSDLRKIAVASLAISDCFHFWFEQVFASKKMNYVKISNLYE